MRLRNSAGLQAPATSTTSQSAPSGATAASASFRSRTISNGSCQVRSSSTSTTKSTILRILREARVVARRQPMTPEQVNEAAKLYEAGLSLSQVAKRLDVNQETMRTAILKAGVQNRPATGADQELRASAD